MKVSQKTVCKRVGLNAKRALLSLLLVVTMCAGMLGFTACDDGDGSHDLTEITVKDSDGNDVKAYANPTKVAVYDYAIMDILHNVGYAQSGIEQLIVPSKTSLPSDLSFYKNKPDSEVVSGGSLFYVDWDVLDIVQPQLVILGARSFGMNANGDRLTSEENAKFKSDTMARYPNTRFVKLSVTTSNAQLTKDMESNVAALKSIFPSLQSSLDEKLTNIKSEIAQIRDKAWAFTGNAMFCMMVDQTSLSVFNPNSRFDMLYEDFGFTPADPNVAAWDSAHGFTAGTEYVLSKNPDVIFVLDRSATVGTGAGYGNFIADETIKGTNAFINDNIFALTGDAWYTMTGGFTAAQRMIADINQFFK